MKSRLSDDRGVALVAVATATTLLLALGLSLALTTTVEVGIAANQRDGVQTLHAADAVLERAIADLASAPDWDAVLAGAAVSPFRDAPGSVVLPDGSTLDVVRETNHLRCGRASACGESDMDAVSTSRPWGRNNPRWTLFASGPLSNLMSDPHVPRAYVVVWVADDPSENDAEPLHDGGPPALVNAANPSNPGRGALWLHARAYGVAGARRTVEAIVERDARWPSTQLRLRVWREVT